MSPCPEDIRFTHSSPVVQARGFPIRIISRIKGTTLRVKLVREYKLPCVTWVHVRCLRIRFLGCINVDQPKMPWDSWKLASGINAAEIETTLSSWFLSEEVVQDRYPY